MSNTRAAFIIAGALGVLIISFGVTLSVYNHDGAGTIEKDPSSYIIEEED